MPICKVDLRQTKILDVSLPSTPPISDSSFVVHSRCMNALSPEEASRKAPDVRIHFGSLLYHYA